MTDFISCDAVVGLGCKLKSTGWGVWREKPRRLLTANGDAVCKVEWVKSSHAVFTFACGQIEWQYSSHAVYGEYRKDSILLKAGHIVAEMHPGGAFDYNITCGTDNYHMTTASQGILASVFWKKRMIVCDTSLDYVLFADYWDGRWPVVVLAQQECPHKCELMAFLLGTVISGEWAD